VLLKAYIDRAAGAGETGANETEDGQVAILMVKDGLTAELSTDSVARGGSFMVNGTTRGVKNVDMVVVAPKGSNGSMICPTGTPYRQELISIMPWCLLHQKAHSQRKSV